MKYLGLLFLFLCLKVYATSPHDSNTLIVKLKSDASFPSLSGVKNIEHFFGNIYKVTSTNIEQTINDLNNLKITEYIERDYLGEKNKLAKPSAPVFSLDPDMAKYFNDPGISRQWHITHKNGVSAEDAYRNRRRSSRETIIVAVVDTGVDTNHEDLKEVLWTNEGEIPGNGIDDDGNGYVDDVHGINTVVRDENGKATGKNSDGHGHGTHVSGIIGAKQNNRKGIAGIASNVKIMGIRAVPNSGDEKDTDVIESFLYAARNGAKIINCSFGKSHNEGGMAVSETIDHIYKEYGTIVVAASGNDGKSIDNSLVYPASFENKSLLVVASSTKSGGLSYFSNYGIKNVDVVAPGSSIYSTVPGNSYRSMSGTSMASPVVAGIAAEILSRFPELSIDELKQNIMDSVAKKKDFKAKVASEGLTDLANAFNLLNQ